MGWLRHGGPSVPLYDCSRLHVTEPVAEVVSAGFRNNRQSQLTIKQRL